MALGNRWDPYDVWHRLLHDNPVSVEDPASSAGAMDASTARDFWASVAVYPDPLQDALFVIAHARGFPAAIAALDRAIRESLRAAEAESRGGDVVPIERPQVPARRMPDVDASHGYRPGAFASTAG